MLNTGRPVASFSFLFRIIKLSNLLASGSLINLRVAEQANKKLRLDLEIAEVVLSIFQWNEVKPSQVNNLFEWVSFFQLFNQNGGDNGTINNDETTKTVTFPSNSNPTINLFRIVKQNNEW